MTLINETLGGHYRLVRLLGRGGMSDVYEALDERTGLAVAVKVLRSSDPEFVHAWRTRRAPSRVSNTPDWFASMRPEPRGTKRSW